MLNMYCSPASVKPFIFLSPLLAVLLTLASFCAEAWAEMPEPGTIDNSFPIRVDHPRKLGAWTLPAERIFIGSDYKPSLALLPDGELIMVAVFIFEPGTKRTHLWRSRDGGRTWSERVDVKGMLGHEPFVTCVRGGTLFVTTCLGYRDTGNKDGYTHAYLHRSTDGGRTWEHTRIGPEGFPPKADARCSRSVVELPDGTLLLGVGSAGSLLQGVGRGKVQQNNFLWTSGDGGKTWQQGKQVTIGNYRDLPFDKYNGDAFFSEDFTYRTKKGKLLHWVRVGPESGAIFPMHDGRPLPDPIKDANNMHTDRMMLCQSTDNGQTWSDLRDFGDYCQMYPRVLRLQDGRLLMTFTQRALLFPIGLRAILSYDDGETWDFSCDQIIINGKTPWGRHGGGCFGNTIQLKDGTLVSCYSYQETGEGRPGQPGFEPLIEVVRWRLPAPLEQRQSKN